MRCTDIFLFNTVIFVMFINLIVFCFTFSYQETAFNDRSFFNLKWQIFGQRDYSVHSSHMTERPSDDFFYLVSILASFTNVFILYTIIVCLPTIFFLNVFMSGAVSHRLHCFYCSRSCFTRIHHQRFSRSLIYLLLILFVDIYLSMTFLLLQIPLLHVMLVPA